MNKFVSRQGMPLLALIGLLIAGQMMAQGTDKEVIRLNRQIDGLIRTIDDIVWSNITIYRLQGDFKNDLIKGMQALDSSDLAELTRIGDVIAPEPLSGFASNSVAVARRARSIDQFKAQICSRYPEWECEYDFDETDMDRAFALAASVVQSENSRPKDFYLVTSRDKENPRLIALLGMNLETTSGTPVILPFRQVGTQLYEYLEANNNSGMYEEMKEAVRGGSQDLANQMFTLRDLAEFEIVDRSTAIARYIDEERYPQVIKSVSAGRPIRLQYTPPPAPTTDSGDAEEPEIDFSALFSGKTDIFGEEESGDILTTAAVPGAVEHPNEIVVGTDVVAGYYAYELDDEKKLKETKWGVELLNNFDEINYPSIWGGRMTMNAILRNIKIGAVLPMPRFGGNTLGESGLFGQPQRILSGYGAAFAGDFTFPVINNSGLFNFYASYTFGESETDKLATTVYPNASDSGLGGSSVKGDAAYLIRYAFQGYYSFGFNVDTEGKHLFRLKLGGTVYGVDEYERQQIFRQGDAAADTVPTLAKLNSSTYGGVSGKIEYMKGGTDIPYGAGLQYFDGSLLSDIWLQFIVARNIDLKLQGKFFTPLFRDARAWEPASLVVPSIELKYHFGTP